ncbi:MAG: hypothetical protein KGP28_01525 [Bdellovibrionales bacterium]|nr:hypothetical protein [Bdellovibrionales bacterium]
MDEFEFQENLAENLLFTFLGGICAIIVGLAIFSTPSIESTTPARSPSSETQVSEFMDSLPVLE